MNFWSRFIIFFGFITMVVVLVACGNAHEHVPSHPLNEVYRLLDKGQTAKAIVILEANLAREPHNQEARALLASAFLGEAGVDVYKIHDSFKDILFEKSLNESFWKSANDSDSNRSNANTHAPPGISPSLDKTLVEKIMNSLDYFLVRLRQFVMFLNRFPDVEKTKWSLLDKALEELSNVEPSKDVCLYRVFIRIIYLRAYFNREILADSEFGSKKWICNLDIEKLKENLIWISGNLSRLSEDFLKVFPDKVYSLAGFQGVIAELLKALEQTKNTSPVGANTGVFLLEERLREVFQCK